MNQDELIKTQIMLVCSILNTFQFPFLAGACNLFNGVKHGNKLDIAYGAASIITDIFSFGYSSIAKATVKKGCKLARIARLNSKLGFLKSVPILQDKNNLNSKQFRKFANGILILQSLYEQVQISQIQGLIDDNRKLLKRCRKNSKL